MLEEIELHTLLEKRLQEANARQRFPHALLLIGPQFINIIDFSFRVTAALFCAAEQKPCEKCKSCRLVNQKEHPDLAYVKPDSDGGIIRIEQIRDLHNLAFTSPQIAKKRVIIIQPAERMNLAAANALLKLLEEPPYGVHFILIAEQISTIPATIISRCQQWQCAPAVQSDSDYLTLGQVYPHESPRGLLFEQLPMLIDDLMALMTNKLSPCALAHKWSNWESEALLWLFYLINAQLINCKLNHLQLDKAWAKQISQLSQYCHVIQLFSQLDQINDFKRKLQQNINLNQALVWENLLLGYTPWK